MKGSNEEIINYSSLARRCLAFLADLSFSYILFYALLSLSTYESKYYHLSQFLIKNLGLQKLSYGPLFTQGLPTLVFVFGIYLVIRFYSTLALGVSLSQWFLGLRGQGDATWKRIGGGARVVLELIMGPLLIGEFFLLFKRRTVKEVLSHTKIVSTEKKITLYLGMIWVPLLIIFSTISPLFEGLTFIDGITINPVKDRLNLKEQGNFSEFSQFNSNRFKFSAFSSLDNSRFLLLPSFEVVKEGSKKLIKPFLWLYDNKSKRDAFIKIEERFSLLKILDKGRLGNPFFYGQFPFLARALGKDRQKFYKRSYLAEYKDDKLLNEEAREDIEKLIKASLELGGQNIFKHLFEFGPFYRGFVSIRNALVDKSLTGVAPEIDFGKIGSSKFLRFTQLFGQKVFLDKQMVETYIPIETNNSLTLRFYWGEDILSALARKAFRETFLQSIVWYFDYKSIFKFPGNSEEVNSLTILDNFTKTDLPQENRNKMEEAIFRIFFKHSRRSIQTGDKGLQGVLLKSLNRIYLVATSINETKNEYYSRKFLVHLRDLRYSLKNKNSKYFGLKR